MTTISLKEWWESFKHGKHNQVVHGNRYGQRANLTLERARKLREAGKLGDYTKRAREKKGGRGKREDYNISSRGQTTTMTDKKVPGVSATMYRDSRTGKIASSINFDKSLFGTRGSMGSSPNQNESQAMTWSKNALSSLRNRPGVKFGDKKYTEPFTRQSMIDLLKSNPLSIQTRHHNSPIFSTFGFRLDGNRVLGPRGMDVPLNDFYQKVNQMMYGID